MRVLDTVRAPDGPLNPIPPEQNNQESVTESVAVTWCREIATSVAAALDTDVHELGYQLTRHPDWPLPHTLYTAFTTTGPTSKHTVRISVMWDDPWREPRVALTVDDQPVAVDTHSPARAAVVLAHAAWQAVADLDTVGSGSRTPPASVLASPAGPHRGGG